MADLLVASGGGHLAQLHRLVDRLPQPSQERTWITFDTPQSRSLLAGEDVRYLPYTGPRAYMQTARNALTAHSVLRDRRYQRVISTGASPALSFLPVTLLHEAEPIYIESAARSSGPSLTGNILSRTPGVRLFTQYEHWSDRKWQYAGSVFDGFEAAPGAGSKEVQRIVVTLGTIDFGFSRLLRRLIDIIPAGVSVTWQVGGTDARRLPIDGIVSLPGKELEEEMRRADVVVAHAGIAARRGGPSTRVAAPFSYRASTLTASTSTITSGRSPPSSTFGGLRSIGPRSRLLTLTSNVWPAWRFAPGAYSPAFACSRPRPPLVLGGEG